MKSKAWNITAVTALVAILCVTPRAAIACGTCLGAPDSPLTAGLNWGIASLLFVVMMVLTGAASFFIYVARRSAALQQLEGDASVSDVSGKVQ